MHSYPTVSHGASQHSHMRMPTPALTCNQANGFQHVHVPHTHTHTCAKQNPHIPKIPKLHEQHMSRFNPSACRFQGSY